MGDTAAKATGPLARSRMFASLAVYNYRRFFIGALVSNVGTWMQSVAQGWLVLTILTDHSSSALGLVTGLNFLAVPFLVPITGVLADRFPKRNILMITQAAMILNSGTLFLLVLTGHVQLWHVYLISFLEGVVNAFDNPARQSFVSEMVDERHLSNAVGLNGTSFNSARLIGPGIAGLVIGAFGVAPALGINALSYVAMIFAVWGMKPEQLHSKVLPKGEHLSASAGLRYIKSRPDIILIMCIVFVLSCFGMNFNVTNATMATTVFGKGAEEFGLLGTTMAIGTLGGALMAARRERPRLMTLMLAFAGFIGFGTVLSLSPSYLLFAILLVPVGFCMLSVVNNANASVQLSTPPELRGRVMAVYMAIFQGATPIGASVVGWVGDVLGPRWSIGIGPLMCGLMLIGAVFYLMKYRGLRASIQKHWPLRVTVWSVVDATHPPSTRQ